jgi:Ca2+-binding RTX toxin-like protein
MARKPLVCLATGIGIALVAATTASASTVRVAAGELQITGVSGGEGSRISVLYRTPEEAGFEGLSARFQIDDAAGAEGQAPECANIAPTIVSCDARPVRLIGADLSDGDDVLVIDQSRDNGVPPQYPTFLGGGPGSDVLRGGLAPTVVFGGLGRDIVAGGAGSDTLSGGPGGDGLIGFLGDDRLFGGTGNDALLGQKGRDLMSGGRGNDVLAARDGFRERMIKCGPGGAQAAVVDRRDPRPRGCGRPKSRGG